MINKRSYNMKLTFETVEHSMRNLDWHCSPDLHLVGPSSAGADYLIDNHRPQGQFGAVNRMTLHLRLDHRQSDLLSAKTSRQHRVRTCKVHSLVSVAPVND